MFSGARNILYFLRPIHESGTRYRVGNNLLLNQTDTPTKPHYVQLLTFLYLLCAFYIVAGLLLVPI